MREIILKSVLSDEQVKALSNQFLTGEHCSESLTTSTIGRTPDGRVRLMFIRNVIDREAQALAESNIGRIGYTARRSNRAAVRGLEGKEAVWGFMEAGPFRPEAGMTALTTEHIEKFINALPFLISIADSFRLYWPEAYGLQERFAAQVPTYVIPGTNGSTVTINSGNLLTRAHTDDGNAVDTVSCLTTLGKFSGGHICIPRYGVVIETHPGDLLIADIRDELHGNIGPVVGERIACVSYLRGGLLSGAKGI
jgi:hypothetical protein